MSALKELINSLVEVINGYHDIKTGKTTIAKLLPIDHLLKMNADELNSTLAKLIEDTAKIQRTRVNFLTYLASIIKDVKSLVDKEEPFSPSEKIFVTKIITDLIYHAQQLSPLSHSALFHFEYNGIKISAYGFETGYVKVTPCTTGDLMRRLFPVPGFTLTSEQYPINKIEQFVETMITDHQNSQLLSQQIESLKQENTGLTATNSELSKNNRGLVVFNKSLQQRLEMLQVQRSVEPVQPSSEPPVTPIDTTDQDPSRIGNFISQFFKSKREHSTTESVGLAGFENNDLDSPHVVSSIQLGN